MRGFEGWPRVTVSFFADLFGQNAPMADRERTAALAHAVRLREQGQTTEAHEHLVALGEQYPNDVGISYQTAWVHDVMGLETEAIPYYQRP